MNAMINGVSDVIDCLATVKEANIEFGRSQRAFLVLESRRRKRQVVMGYGKSLEKCPLSTGERTGEDENDPLTEIFYPNLLALMDSEALNS